MTVKIKDDSDLKSWNLIKQVQSLKQTIDILTEKLQRLNEVNNQLEKNVEFANEEIADYYNSTSWKITRPLRWIIKKIRGKSV